MSTERELFVKNIRISIYLQTLEINQTRNHNKETYIYETTEFGNTLYQLPVQNACFVYTTPYSNYYKSQEVLDVSCFSFFSLYFLEPLLIYFLLKQVYRVTV
jgi:hypothetical protein